MQLCRKIAQNELPALGELDEAQVARYFERVNSEGESSAAMGLPGVRKAVKESSGKP